ncbi:MULTISPECIES: peptide deformylase [Hymenobacter]|uniref:Peptide deformylase n=1 Tax=Hymenobacter profundi TaxID=1982110 RepID=A0ABS6X1V3_9BACT|nr:MULTISPECIES: peptide deformylase [Hymenobacter]MBW3129649.1 peptide deformylase [Hymenobacter profundi]QNE40936.1 peptide deformylase [Hymenobacter sp. NBH84]
MIYPVVAFGDPVLKARARDLPADFSADELKQLVADMYDTMYYAHGVGLAAPQIGKSVRLFVIDSAPMVDEEDENGEPVQLEATAQPVKRAFINPQIIHEEGEEWGFEEGCLSIPGVREMVYRQPVVTLRYEDENRQSHEETFSGMTARVIQHEYDHLEGVLFTDKISSFKKQFIKGKLARISKGDVKADYRMRFPLVKQR